ncbi:70 kDa peptidyl-prolyl isomerase, partial [Trifolium pratense]
EEAGRLAVGGRGGSSWWREISKIRDGVSVKVSVFAWRFFRNRLPTKDNLAMRNIIPHDSQLCVTSCGGTETAHHLFLSFPVFTPLWYLLISWIGISSVDLSLLQDHFVPFIHSFGGQRACRSFMRLI